MFTMIVAALVGVWLLGMATSYTLGGFIHLLLLAAVAVLLVKMFWDRRPLPQ